MELMEGGTFEDAAKAWHFSESNIAYIAREVLPLLLSSCFSYLPPLTLFLLFPPPRIN